MTVLKGLHKIGLLSFFIPPITKEVPTQAFGLTFKNPIGIAAGLDKNGDYIDCLAALGVGFIEVGAVTPRAQIGNPKPRLFRIKAKKALINRMGFNNKGVDYLVQRLQEKKSTCLIGVNLGKNKDTPLEQAANDYLICFKKVYEYADFVTLNISSPNTLGLKDLQTDTYLRDLLITIKEQRSALLLQTKRYVPVLVKIAPDLSEEEVIQIGETVVAVGLDGLIATNTTMGRAAVAGLPHAEETGGLSGAPLKVLSAQALAHLKNADITKRLDVISAGGIDSADEAARRLHGGAKLIQIYTGLIYQGPGLIRACVEMNISELERQHE